MPTWGYILIVIAVVAIVGLLIHQHNLALAAAAKAKGSSASGAVLVNAAEKIPVYGTFVSAAKVVAKPVNHALEKVNSTITAGLQHIPIAGKYLAMPNQIAGSAVHKINSWLGLT